MRLFPVGCNSRVPAVAKRPPSWKLTPGDALKQCPCGSHPGLLLGLLLFYHGLTVPRCRGDLVIIIPFLLPIRPGSGRSQAPCRATNARGPSSTRFHRSSRKRGCRSAGVRILQTPCGFRRAFKHLHVLGAAVRGRASTIVPFHSYSPSPVQSTRPEEHLLTVRRGWCGSSIASSRPTRPGHDATLPLVRYGGTAHPSNRRG